MCFEAYVWYIHLGSFHDLVMKYLSVAHVETGSPALLLVTTQLSRKLDSWNEKLRSIALFASCIIRTALSSPFSNSS